MGAEVIVSYHTVRIDGTGAASASVRVRAGVGVITGRRRDPRYCCMASSSSPQVAVRLTNYFADIRPAATPQLFPESSDGEREILDLIAGGLKNPEIAQRPYLSPQDGAKPRHHYPSQATGSKQDAGNDRRPRRQSKGGKVAVRAPSHHFGRRRNWQSHLATPVNGKSCT